MGFWKKESKTSFVRNEAGKVVEVKRSGDQPRSSGTPVSDALMKQHYEKHPEQRPGTKAKKRIGGIVTSFDNYAKNYAKNHQPPKSRAKQHSSSVKSGKAKPPLGMYSFSGNSNPFGDMFDSGMSSSPRQKRKTQSSKKYAIVKGKAYPIAGSGKKKKKTGSKTGGKRRKKYDPNDPFSFPDLW